MGIVGSYNRFIVATTQTRSVILRLVIVWVTAYKAALIGGKMQTEKDRNDGGYNNSHSIRCELSCG